MDLPIRVTQKAKLKSLSPDATEVEAHFNPVSMVYTVENSTKQQSGDPKRRQFAAQFSGKLTMDLQFDTTDTGEDVRQTTNKIARFMQSSAGSGTNPSSGNAQAQPVVSFEWGAYEFRGTLESFKETIDFFSAEGVPLRAIVSIGLARQDQVFDENATYSSSNVTGSLVPTGRGDDATSLATMGGDPTAARQLGASNGLATLRFTAGASLNVSAGIQLNAAAGFSAPASAGGDLSIGASAGVASAAGLKLSAGAGGGALFGGKSSAGVPATAGAFAGIEAGRATVSSTARLDPLRMLPATASADVSTGENASFSLGGAAKAGAGFTSNVGPSFNLNDRLIFDQE